MAAQKTVVQELAATVADIYLAAGSHIGAPHPVFHAAGNGDPQKLGMCIAASLMQAAMCQHPEGLAAFRDLVYKPALDDVQGE